MKYQCLACKAADNCELSWKDPTEEYMNCTEFKAPPRTNADRIRSMTDEELSSWINDHADCNCRCKAWKDGCMDSDSTCMAAWLEWLKEEVKE